MKILATDNLLLSLIKNHLHLRTAFEVVEKHADFVSLMKDAIELEYKLIKEGGLGAIMDNYSKDLKESLIKKEEELKSVIEDNNYYRSAIGDIAKILGMTNRDDFKNSFSADDVIRCAVQLMSSIEKEAKGILESRLEHLEKVIGTFIAWSQSALVESATKTLLDMLNDAEMIKPDLQGTMMNVKQKPVKITKYFVISIPGDDAEIIKQRILKRCFGIWPDGIDSDNVKEVIPFLAMPGKYQEVAVNRKDVFKEN